MALNKRTYIDRETVITADNLNDIQDSIITLESEIDDKVNEPSTEGTAGQVLATDGAGTRYWKTVSGGGGGTSDYTDLDNKPQINGVTLVGNKATADLGISYNDLTNKPTIPSAVTEATVSGWGFTKNTGDYSKPAGGIPKTDLASAVQTSLGLADTALQSYTETDPTVPSHVKSITQADIAKWNAGGGGSSDIIIVDGTPTADTKLEVDTSDTEEDVIYTKAEVDALVKDNYSTSETIIGTWIDGKPIYRQVKRASNIAIPTEASNIPSALAPSNSNTIAELVNARCLLSQNGTYLAQLAMQIAYNGTAYRWKSLDAWSADNLRCITVVYEYTKTTD